MSPSANVAAWRAPPKRAWVRVAKATGAAVAVLIASQYFAGYVFLRWFRLDPHTASPLTVARYAYYHGDRDDVRRRAWLSSAAGLTLALAPALGWVLPKRRALHGSARFARRAEIARAGLFAKEGIFLGRFGRRYLILGGQQGAIVSAPPRADKGTAIVLPNCLSFPGSLICLDVKLENWTLSAGFRTRLGQPCHLINPLDPDGNTARNNPLSYVSSHPARRITGLQRIATTLFPEIPGTDPFWTAGGRGMFLGLALYVLETPSLPATLGEVLRQSMASDAEGFSEHWKRIINGRQSGKYPLSATCVRAIADIVDLAPVTASSIRKTFTSRMDLFANPLIDAATSCNDFDWRDLRKRPMSVYLGIQPGDLHLLRPLLNLLLEQAISLQTEELPEHNPDLKHQVLMLLDETTAPGKIPILAQAISYLPGYNVRILMVIQAYSQLREVYGANAADTMMKSLAARVLYAPKDFVEANEISQELGMTTVPVSSISRPRHSLFARRAERQGSISTSEQRRPLLLPQEVKELGRDRELLLYEGLRPILGKKNRYYQDPLFRKRLFPPPQHARPSFNPEERRPDGPRTPAAQDEMIDCAPRTREATEADLERIDELRLEDIDIDLSAVEVPHHPDGRPLGDDELNVAVESFLTTLRER